LSLGTSVVLAALSTKKFFRGAGEYPAVKVGHPTIAMSWLLMRERRDTTPSMKTNSHRLAMSYHSIVAEVSDRCMTCQSYWRTAGQRMRPPQSLRHSLILEQSKNIHQLLNIDAAPIDHYFESRTDVRQTSRQIAELCLVIGLWCSRSVRSAELRPCHYLIWC
jgi:hypothetical protein